MILLDLITYLEFKNMMENMAKYVRVLVKTIALSSIYFYGDFRGFPEFA